MKPHSLPDWFAPVFAWASTILLFAASLNPPYDVNVNRELLLFAPLLAVAWTSGWIGMIRFKNRYPTDHEALGGPQLFGSPFEARSWQLAAYLLQFRFLRLGDAVVSVGFTIFVGLKIIGMIWLLVLFWKRA